MLLRRWATPVCGCCRYGVWEVCGQAQCLCVLSGPSRPPSLEVMRASAVAGSGPSPAYRTDMHACTGCSVQIAVCPEIITPSHHHCARPLPSQAVVLQLRQPAALLPSGAGGDKCSSGSATAAASAGQTADGNSSGGGGSGGSVGGGGGSGAAAAAAAVISPSQLEWLLPLLLILFLVRHMYGALVF